MLLLRASEKGDYETLETVIDKGADVNYQDINFHGLDGPWYGYKAIECAAKNGYDECLQLLIKAGANVNDSTALECTALYGHDGCMDILIKAGADVNIKDEMGYTALMHAGQEGYEKCVRVLIEAGADVNLSDETGYTALIVAANSGHDGIVKLLIDAGADVNHFAKGSQSSVDWSSCESTTPLISAAGSKECLQLLIEAGADANFANNNGDTAILKAAIKGSCECLQILIGAGANVNTSNHKGETALMLTSKRGRSLRESALQCVKLLLKSGAHVNKTNDGGGKAIECYKSHKTPDKRIVKLLAAAGERQDDDVNKVVKRLKHLCREVIRQHLLHLSPMNLFLRATELGKELPVKLVPYLLYHMSLEGGHGTKKETGKALQKESRFRMSKVLESNGHCVNNEQRDSDKTTSLNQEGEKAVNKEEGANVINGKPVDIIEDAVTTVNKQRPSVKGKTGARVNDEISNAGPPTKAN